MKPARMIIEQTPVNSWKMGQFKRTCDRVTVWGGVVVSWSGGKVKVRFVQYSARVEIGFEVRGGLDAAFEGKMGWMIWIANETHITFPHLMCPSPQNWPTLPIVSTDPTPPPCPQHNLILLSARSPPCQDAQKTNTDATTEIISLLKLTPAGLHRVKSNHGVISDIEW